MAANIATSEPGGPVAHLAMLVHRWIRALWVACRVLEGHGWLGPVEIRSELVFTTARVENSGFLGIHLGGLQGIEDSTVQQPGFASLHHADHSQLAAPASLIAEMLARHLREQLGFPADFDWLRETVELATEKVTQQQP